MAPRAPQEGPKRRPDSRKRRPRSPQEAPRRPPRGLKSIIEAPKTLTEVPGFAKILLLLLILLLLVHCLFLPHPRRTPL
eukprot:6371904-Pyramimonas_sp.AAC.1